MGTSSDWDAILNNYEILGLTGFAEAIANIQQVAISYGGLPPMSVDQLDHLKNISIDRWADGDTALVSSMQAMDVISILTDPYFYSLSSSTALIFENGYIVSTPNTWQKIDEVGVFVPRSANAGWTLLDTKNVAIAISHISGWQQISQVGVSVPRDTSVVAGGWRKLSETSALIGRGIDFKAFELIRHVDFPESSTYRGNAEQVIFYFESLSVFSWIGFAEDQIINAFTSELGKQGAVPLTVDLYKGSGILTSSYIVKIIAYEKVSAAYNGALPLFTAIAWGVIIVAVLVALAIVIYEAKEFVDSVTNLVYGPPGKGNPVTSTAIAIGIGGLVVLGVILAVSASGKREVRSSG